MRGLIVGTDLLEYNDTVKVIELNTNVGIPNKVMLHIDVTPFFNKLIELGISELHFIYTRGYGGETYVDNEELDGFTILLKNMCLLNNIQFFTYPVQQHTLVVPYVEDNEDRFILRHSYDDTALVDSFYCADKYNLVELIKDESYGIKTFTSNFDTLDNVDYTSENPNIVVKNRYPVYDSNFYPELHVLDNSSELSDLKVNLLQNNLIQEFIFDEKNIVENRHSVIRSLDILYGSTLETLNIGVYRTTSLVDMDFTTNILIDGTKKLTKKSRFKYINKKLGDNMMVYHADDESLILKSDNTTVSVDDIYIGDSLFSIDFTDKNGVSPSGENFRRTQYNGDWDSTIQNDSTTLTTLDANVESIEKKTYDTLFIEIILSNGEFWNDSLTAEYYIEEKNSNKTNWKYVNEFEVGDKLVTIDINTNELTTIEITSLTPVFDTIQIYTIDVEPTDLFLVDIGESKMAIMHNVDCFNCFNQSWCGLWGCELGCPQCTGGKY
jgi:hypothetical protein